MPPVNFNMAELKSADIQEFRVLVNRAVNLHIAWLKEQGFGKRMIGTITSTARASFQFIIISRTDAPIITKREEIIVTKA